MRKTGPPTPAQARRTGDGFTAFPEERAKLQGTNGVYWVPRKSHAHVMKKAVALLIATAALAAPASALGTVPPAMPQLAAPMPPVRSAQASAVTNFPANVTPNRKALGAYEAYLNAILQNASAAQAADTAYIATISGSNGCRSALAPLTQPSQQVNTAVMHTLQLLGQEMGDDLTINFDQPALPAFTKFATTLLHLHWVRLSGALPVVRHYVNAETTVLQLLPSQLCQDALLAGTYPQRVPEGTKTFVKGYDKASALANLALANLTKMMQSYEVPSEKNLITRITNLANQVAALTKSDLLQSGAVLSSTLESS